MRITNPGFVLAAGVAAAALAASAPAGLRGQPVPIWSWVAWCAVAIASIALMRAKSGGLVVALRPLAMLLPTVLALTLPALLFTAAERGTLIGSALVARSLATAGAALATVTYLGPVQLVAGLRALRFPARLVDVIHAMLVGLAAVSRQVAAMLRARASRGTGQAPWPALIASPVSTSRGFGRITASLLLRSLERAEAQERARRARGEAPR
jgi:energy-coupling factor transporter transmembrane protein EcfT